MHKYLSFLIITFLFLNCSKEETPPSIVLRDFIMLAPKNKAEVEKPVNLKWSNSVEGAVYKLKISLDEDFSELILEEENIRDTTYDASAVVFPSTIYFWSVTAYLPETGSEKQCLNGIYSFSTKYEKPTPSPNKTKYYVGPNGTDNGSGGTLQQPFKTIAFAASMVPENEGDTIYLLAGTYFEENPIKLATGINLIGESTESVIIQSEGFVIPGISNDDQIKKISRSALIQLSSNTIVEGNQEVSHFTLDGKNKSLKSGIWFENRSNISLHDVFIKYTDLRGAVIATTQKSWYQEPNEYLVGVEVYNCTFKNCGKDLASETLGNLNLGQLDGAEIHDITITDSEGYGIKFMWDGYYKNCNFYNIKTTLNETDKLWGEDIGIELWNLGPGNQVYNIEANTWLSLVNHANIFGEKAEELNLSLHDVKIIDNDGKSSKEGLEIGTPHAEIFDCYIENKAMSIAVWNMGRENILIKNNIFSNSKYQVNWAGGAGVYIDNSTEWSFKNIRIYNNVFDGHVNAVRIKGDNLMDFYIKNNLFLNSRDNDVFVDGGENHFEHNFLHVTNSETWKLKGEITANNNFEGNAKIQNAGEKWGAFYQLTTESPLINAGVDVGIPFNGSAPDIGFHETIK